MALTIRELQLQDNTDVLGYIQMENAKRDARAMKEGWTFWTRMPETPDFAAEFKNVYDLEHMFACGMYSDVWKECYCARPVHQFDNMTLEELETKIEEMIEQ